MPTVTIPDNQWLRIYEFLRAHRRSYAGKEANCRRFVEGVLWIARSGAQSRLLPETYGSWNSVYKRFARWCDSKVWEQLHQHFVDDPDMEHLLVDSTVVRAHPCAAGALKKGRSFSRCSLATSRSSSSFPLRPRFRGLDPCRAPLFSLDNYLLDCAKKMNATVIEVNK